MEGWIGGLLLSERGGLLMSERGGLGGKFCFMVERLVGSLYDCLVG